MIDIPSNLKNEILGYRQNCTSLYTKISTLILVEPFNLQRPCRMSLLRKDKRHLAADLGFHGNFSFPNGYQRQTKLSANLPIVFHSLSSFRGGVITNVPDAEGCQITNDTINVHRSRKSTLHTSSIPSRMAEILPNVGLPTWCATRSPSST